MSQGTFPARQHLICSCDDARSSSRALAFRRANHPMLFACMQRRMAALRNPHDALRMQIISRGLQCSDFPSCACAVHTPRICILRAVRRAGAQSPLSSAQINCFSKISEQLSPCKCTLYSAPALHRTFPSPPGTPCPFNLRLFTVLHGAPHLNLCTELISESKLQH